MKILVTGGAGFIGSHIVDLLAGSGHVVSIADDLSTGRFENINPAVNFYRVSVASEEFGEVVARERPDAVVHQAAQVDVQHSLRDPLADAETNIQGSINLLEACRRFGVGKVVYASSAAVYGNPLSLPVDEEHPLVPRSPYGASKLAAEHYFRVYSEVYGVRYTVLRYANVYGPRQDAAGEGGVVAIFIDRLLKGEPPSIFGDGEQTRDFVFVRDVALANMAALHGGDGMVLNVGTGKATSVNDLFREIKKITGSPLEALYCPPRPGDITHSYLANGRIRRVLGWNPSCSLEDGLRETVGHYRKVPGRPEEKPHG
ncbi:MAG: SDR family oxidoreductase [Pelotomaculum sp.]|nr:SDR family oxidoreductase [Pelotomaculum sp.]